MCEENATYDDTAFASLLFFSTIVCTFLVALAHKMFTVRVFSLRFCAHTRSSHCNRTHGKNSFIFCWSWNTAYARVETKSGFSDESMNHAMKFNARNLFAENVAENTFFLSSGCCLVVLGVWWKAFIRSDICVQFRRVGYLRYNDFEYVFFWYLIFIFSWHTHAQHRTHSRTRATWRSHSTSM